jgi:hypothetical protein
MIACPPCCGSTDSTCGSFPNDYPPAHVHVYKAGTFVVIALDTPTERLSVREIAGMSSTDVVKAFLIVEDHSSFLWEKWEDIHG